MFTSVKAQKHSSDTEHSPPQNV